MLHALLQALRRQVFPILVAGMLNTGRRLGAAMNQTAPSLSIQRAGKGLLEGLTPGAQAVTPDGLVCPCVDGSLFIFRQSGCALQRLTDGYGFKPRDMDVDEMSVQTASAGRGAGAARSEEHTSELQSRQYLV